MKTSLYICLYKAGDHCAPLDRPYPPAAVLHAQAENIRFGENGLFVYGVPATVTAVELAGGSKAQTEAFHYDFRYFDAAQRNLSRAATESLERALRELQPEMACWAKALVPAVVAVAGADQLDFYHYVQQGASGALFLHYGSAPLCAGEATWQTLVSQLQACHPTLAKAWPLLNDDCWYTKWRSDVEMERKFTFTDLPDTWALVNQLYDEVLAGRLQGFVPELDREFQVFDYESHVFEVCGADPAEAGYISFIPQADGRMTVKRKWFVENTEIRRETVTPNLLVQPGEMDLHLKTMTSAPVRRMPVFRRKRFDVNFESLRTGNVFGVYFDICRTETPAHAFAQCEVEYCRSRTFKPLRDVVEEFDVVSEYTRDFLVRKKVPFRQDLFSKLDFVRDAQAMARDAATV